TGEPTPRASIALVGAWSAIRVPLTKAPTRAARAIGFIALPPSPRGGPSAFELAGEQPDVGIELRILRAQFLDLADCVDHRRMVASAEAAADLGQRARGELLREVHGDLAWPRNFPRTPRRGHLGLADPVMLGDAGLDLVDRDSALVGAKGRGQHFGDEIEVDHPVL